MTNIQALVRGDQASLPEYDMAAQRRLRTMHNVPSAEVVIVEGHLVLALDELLPLQGLRIYVAAPDEVRLARRLKRDVAERGRTSTSVLEQWWSSVLPMHYEYVESSRTSAHLVVDGTAAVHTIVAAVEGEIADSRRRRRPAW